MKIEIKDFDINDVNKEKNKIFIYEDNYLKSGKNIFRNLKNTLPINTKLGASNKSVAFLTDDKLKENKEKLFKDIHEIKKYL